MLPLPVPDEKEIFPFTNIETSFDKKTTSTYIDFELHELVNEQLISEMDTPCIDIQILNSFFYHDTRKVYRFMLSQKDKGEFSYHPDDLINVLNIK